ACIDDFEAQKRTLARAAHHLQEGGLLVVDVVNPLALKLAGDAHPIPFFTRKNPHTGRPYTRFAMCDPLDERQRQRLHGWYDELDAEGRVQRSTYSIHWRPIFRFELELMLEHAGLVLEKIEGGHQGEAFVASSPRMLVYARKRARGRAA